MKFPLFAFSLLLSVAVSAQDIEDIFEQLPGVVTDLTPAEAEFFMEEGSIVTLSGQDSVGFEILEKEEGYIRYRQAYINRPSSQFYYEIRVYERIREQGHIIAVSRQVGTGDNQWQRDFQLFEYTPDEEVFGIPPLDRTNMLRYAAPVIRDYSNSSDYLVLVELNPSGGTVSGFTFKVMRTADYSLETAIPIKWNGTGFSAR
ncbi:MAG: hypothetical protein HWD92_11715 [Flavobacteriia bacterium]|nr:hypothetical protein [Flavobacteriia bacterium]